MIAVHPNQSVVSHEGISKVDICVAQLYMLFSCIVALVCSSWTLDNYMNGSLTMRAYSWIGTVSSALLLCGLRMEGVVYRRGCCGPCTSTGRAAEKIRKRGLGVSMVHIATSSISIFSMCASAVNIYENASAGLYAISCAVLAFNWVYNVMYTPSTVMYLAAYAHLPEAEQLIIAFQQQSTRYVWRNSKVNPTDYL